MGKSQPLVECVAQRFETRPVSETAGKMIENKVVFAFLPGLIDPFL
jgi:hypothetical protein